MPAMPPLNEIRIASARNWKRMARLVAPMALRIPISRMRDVTVASMMFMIPMPLTSSVTNATSIRMRVRASAIRPATVSS